MKQEDKRPRVPIARLANYDGPEPASFPEAKPAEAARGDAPKPKTLASSSPEKPKQMPFWWRAKEWLGQKVDGVVDAWEHHHTMMGRAWHQLPTWERTFDPTPKGKPYEPPEAQAYAEPVKAPSAALAQTASPAKASPPKADQRGDPIPAKMPKSSPSAPAGQIASPFVPMLDFAKTDDSRPSWDVAPRVSADMQRGPSAPRQPESSTGPTSSADLLDALRETVAALKELTRSMQNMGGDKNRGDNSAPVSAPGFQPNGSFKPMGFDHLKDAEGRQFIQRLGSERGAATIRNMAR